MKLDIFNHIFPRAFYERALEVAPNGKDMFKRVRDIPCIVDLDERFRIMDGFDDYAQVICLGSPPIEVFGPPPVSTEMARLANDGMAELVAKYPARFPAFIASLPMNDPDGLLRETERAINKLGAVGVQVFTNVLGKPLTAPETLPLFDLMASLDRPIWLHPARGADFPDYKGEKKSHYEIWWTFGWPYETSAAMAHMVFEGLFDKHPNLKIITHHMGGMIPYFAGRIELGFRQIFFGAPDRNPGAEALKKAPRDYFKMLYADTALNGDVAATRCGHDYFGTSRCLFATDAPFDAEQGKGLIAKTIAAVEALDIGKDDRARIFAGNARELLKLR